jgi:hypothetical protein
MKIAAGAGSCAATGEARLAWHDPNLVFAVHASRARACALDKGG